MSRRSRRWREMFLPSICGACKYFSEKKYDWDEKNQYGYCSKLNDCVDIERENCGLYYYGFDSAEKTKYDKEMGKCYAINYNDYSNICEEEHFNKLLKRYDIESKSYIYVSEIYNCDFCGTVTKNERIEIYDGMMTPRYDARSHYHIICDRCKPEILKESDIKREYAETRILIKKIENKIKEMKK
jgi:hypothetical protein